MATASAFSGPPRSRPTIPGELLTGLSLNRLPSPRRLVGRLLDHGNLAIRQAKAQPLRVALRGCAALRDHDRILASGSDRGRHANTQQCRLQAASAKFSKCTRAAQSKDSVLWDDQPG